jgi:hypothetical protein
MDILDHAALCLCIRHLQKDVILGQQFFGTIAQNASVPAFGG